MNIVKNIKKLSKDFIKFSFFMALFISISTAIAANQKGDGTGVQTGAFGSQDILTPSMLSNMVIDWKNISNKPTTATEKTHWNNIPGRPNTGIPCNWVGNKAIYGDTGGCHDDATFICTNGFLSEVKWHC
jgi:hypothetical protein